MGIVKDEELLISKLLENKKRLEHEEECFGIVFSMQEGFKNAAFGFNSFIYPKLEEYLKSIDGVIREMVKSAVAEENERITKEIKELAAKL